MDIIFRTKKLEKVFNSKKKLVQEYGQDNAKKLMRRMTVLFGAPNLLSVPTSPPDHCHELSSKRKGLFAVDIKQPYRLIFKPAHDPIPLKDDLGIDLTKVTAIEIQGIEDYH